MTKKIWNFDRLTGLLTGEGTADADPMSPGSWLIPASATDKAPPAPGDHQTAAFKNGYWSLVADWRGVLLYGPGEARTPTALITEMGKLPADVGATEVPPPAAGVRQVAVLTTDRAWELRADWRGVPLWRYDSQKADSLTITGVTPGERTLTTVAPPDGYPCTFDGVKWAVNDAAVRLELWGKIKAERDRRTQSGGYRVGTDWFHSDSFSRTQHIGLKDRARDLLAAGGTLASVIKIAGEPVRWKTMGGTFAAMTVQLAFDVVNAAGESDVALFKAAEAHRAALQASASPKDYNILTGWPMSFEG